MRCFRLACWVVLLGSSALSCGQDDNPSPPPLRDCTTTLYVERTIPSASVQVVGSWNHWGPGYPVEISPSGWGKLWLQLPPGEHGYLIVENDTERLDPRNALTTFRGNTEVSLAIAPDCSSPALELQQVACSDDGTMTIEARFLAASDASALEPSSVVATTFEGLSVPVIAADPATGIIRAQVTGLSAGKHTVRLRAFDRSGRGAEAARAVCWVRSPMATWSDGLLYQIVVDRFRGDGGRALTAPVTPGSRAGGTYDGVRAEIERGTFESMGVTALWLSPPYVNPDEAREGRGDGKMYEGYHGYWPLESREVEPRFGGREALLKLVQTAHAHGLRVLLDIVPNHVYERNPVYLEHAYDGWFHQGEDKCVCGDPGCGWDTDIQHCWFTPYLPDFRWQHPDVMRHGVQESLWWAEEFDLDGVRIDAVPMMPRAATRRIAHALRSTSVPRESRFVLGEVFTGGGQGGIDVIRYYLGPDGLDSAFDFPLMWSMRDAIAADRSGFDSVDEVFEASTSSFDGSGAIIARMLGNHDTTRFLSEANGDAAGDPWADPPEQPSQAEPYRRHRLALALTLTLPGLPLIYYGDEVGLAGGSDPDCRRVMPAESELLPEQVRILEAARVLGRLRSCSKALRTGDKVPLVIERDVYGFVRDAGDGLPVIALFSKAPAVREVAIEPGAVPAGTYVDVITGQKFVLGATGGDGTVAVESLDFRVLVAESHPCRPALAMVRMP